MNDETAKADDTRWRQRIQAEGGAVAEQLGMKLVPADAVVIRREDIPTDLPGDLLEMAEESGEYRVELGHADTHRTAARLLAGGGS